MNKRKTVYFIFHGIEYEADVVLKIHRDNNYGADANGKRGITRDFIDEIEVEEVRERGGDTATDTALLSEMEEYIDEAVENIDLEV